MRRAVQERNGTRKVRRIRGAHRLTASHNGPAAAPCDIRATQRRPTAGTTQYAHGSAHPRDRTMIGPGRAETGRGGPPGLWPDAARPRDSKAGGEKNRIAPPTGKLRPGVPVLRLLMPPKPGPMTVSAVPQRIASGWHGLTCTTAQGHSLWPGDPRSWQRQRGCRGPKPARISDLAL